MINGMTGFGSTQISQGQVKVMVEIKSVNHRYFDTSFYLPAGFGSIENRIRQIIQKHIERGRINLSIKIIQKSFQEVFLNKDNVRAHLKYAKLLEKEFRLENDLTLSDIIRLPGVLETKESSPDPETLWPMLERGLLKSLQGLVNMRKREGRALVKDVSEKLGLMMAQSKNIRRRQASIVKEQQKKMGREEFQSFQKSSDINEELSRLTHYIDELKLLLKSSVPVGKKIDFVAQEMQRETNTIGSKVQDKIVSNAVIALKSKIEKIREQSQNIE